MCGLSAIVDFAGSAEAHAALLAMHARIPHRGPDGEGFCVLHASGAVRSGAAGTSEPPTAIRAGLAFRWLQIQDLSPAAAQPMASADGGVHLIFNGEIYNFRTLRPELERLGHAFRTDSDTEVVLAAWLQWDVKMFERLDGMWAIVLLDLRTRRLVASRDRFGIKPLYLLRQGARLLFASEAKQLLAAGASREANAEVVARFILGARAATPEETFFGAITAQPAATYCEIDLDRAPARLEFTPYWTLPAKESAPVSLDAATERLDELLRVAAREHMEAQVPVGILASGGLDSSLVAALARPSFAARGQAPAAFSMVLDPSEPLDESRWIGRIVEALGYTGHRARLDAAALKARVDAVTVAQEEPVAGMAVVGQHLTLELAAANRMRVVLDGQGADELFGGYPRHQAAYIGGAARRGAWAEVAAESLALAWRDPRFFKVALAGRVASPRGPGAAGVLRRAPRGSEGAPPSLEETLRRDVLTGNLRWVLALTDRNAMAHSIEARVPYVSRGVVEFAFSLPDRFKTGAGRRKRILRRVAERHLPRDLVYRPNRLGFGTPTGRWLAEAFATELRELARGEVFASSGIVDPDGVGRFVEAFLAGGHADAGTVWRLYAVDRWARVHSATGL